MTKRLPTLAAIEPAGVGRHRQTDRQTDITKRLPRWRLYSRPAWVGTDNEQCSLHANTHTQCTALSARCTYNAWIKPFKVVDKFCFLHSTSRLMFVHLQPHLTSSSQCLHYKQTHVCPPTATSNQITTTFHHSLLQ